jgi:hypothetical protein
MTRADRQPQWREGLRICDPLKLDVSEIQDDASFTAASERELAGAIGRWDRGPG